MSEERFDRYDDVFEGLAKDARVEVLPGFVMDVKDDAGLKAARETIARMIADGHTSQADLARRTGASQAAISQFLNDRWKGRIGTLHRVASDLARAVNNLLKQREAEDSRVGGFVSIEVSEKIFALARWVHKHRLIGGFTLQAGGGKSMAVEALADEIPGAILLVASRTRSSVKSFLQLWARSLGVDETGRAEDVKDRIENRLRGTGRLTLIDEAHKLQVPTLDVVREVHDATKAPILFAATPVFRQMLTSRRVGTASREILDQLASRVAPFEDFHEQSSDRGDGGKLYTVADIRRIYHRGKVRLSRGAAEYLTDLANAVAGGGLRRCQHVVQLAAVLWPDAELTAEHLDKALSKTFGARDAKFIRSIMTGPEPAEPAAAAG